MDEIEHKVSEALQKYSSWIKDEIERALCHQIEQHFGRGFADLEIAHKVSEALQIDSS